MDIDLGLESKSMEDRPSNIKFFYIKSNLFRVLHVDGAVGGLTPHGSVHIAVYSERPAIPQMTSHNLSPEGRVGEPEETEGKEGIVREIDADLILSRQTAVELRDFLTRNIAMIDGLRAEQSENK